MKATAVNAKLDLLESISAQLQAPRSKVPRRTPHPSSDPKPTGDLSRTDRTNHPEPMPVPSSESAAPIGGRMEILMYSALMIATVVSLGWMAYLTLSFALP